MPRRRNPKSGRSPPRRARWSARATIRLALVMLMAGSAIAAWLLWLDQEVQAGFEGRRWSLPALVYARAVDIYPGQRIGPAELERILRRVGYARHPRLSGPGSYQRAADVIHLHTRRFRYWDGVEASKIVDVRFADGRVQDLRDPAGNAIGIIRIEPRLIGKIYPEHDEDRVLVSWDEVPRDLIDALVAVEDRSFFSHAGIDLRGILRAAWVNLRSGAIVQGGSTLTQQLVKNFFLHSERDLVRKINEMLMALLLERRYSKEQILGTYINEIYLGQHGARGIHGFGTAAGFYYGRPLHELRLDQLALLAGMVRGASYYNPRRHPGRARERRDLVLQLMHEQGFLGASELSAARSRPLDVTAKPGWSQDEFPDFLDLVRRQLLQGYSMEQLRSQGLQIFTTLDPVLQQDAQSALGATVTVLESERGMAAGTLQAAALIIDTGSGDVLAAVGARNPEVAAFNRSIDARRPVGSLIKPFVYLAALQQPARYSILSELADTPLALPAGGDSVWKPDNYDHEFRGAVSLMESLINSYNVSTVRLGLEVGLDRVIDVLHGAGLERRLAPLPSLLLGAVELSPIEVAQAYQTLAAGGFRAPLNGIRDVLDRDGNGLSRHAIELEQSLDPRATYLVNYLLMQVTREGTGRALAETIPDRLPLAGKTGTTNDLRDSWFAGFGDGMLGVVWVGRDDNRPTGLSGATGAMRVWAALIDRAGMRPLSLPAPAGVGWDGPIRLQYGRECRTFATVPYIEPYRPAGAPACDGR
ncbi:MAG TPA: penicillin-binding protein 1B [Gammaproteobacteria bacterium]